MYTFHPLQQHPGRGLTTAAVTQLFLSGSYSVQAVFVPCHHDQWLATSDEFQHTIELYSLNGPSHVVVSLRLALIE
jgi:hypothetical protein